MPEKHTILSPALERDGTSQGERMLEALRPGYVSVDERSLKDLLRFARAYGKELNYFNAENQAFGDWSGFISDDQDLDEIVSFMNDPEEASSSKKPALSRPHLLLFLSFLKLLQEAQKQMNGLTKRHLDFYYQQVLRMQKKPGRPDRVNLLFKAQDKAETLKLPAGTSLNAGPDASGVDRLYQTDRDLLASQAQIQQLSTVYAEKDTVGIREARESRKGTPEERFVQMLEIALGQPLPGDALPKDAALSDTATATKVDFAYLTQIGNLLAFSESGLFMPLFELRALIKLKRQRDRSGGDWKAIQTYLTRAARKKRSNTTFDFQSSQPRNFDQSLLEAIGEVDYAGLTEVTHIDHLYAQRFREEVRRFVLDKLFFDRFDDFVAMMQIKIRIDGEWEEINRILEAASRRKQGKPKYRFSPELPAAFSANLSEAIGPLSTPLFEHFSDLEAYFKAIEHFEAYFYLSAEKIAELIRVGQAADATDWDWKNVEESLLAAHRQKTTEARREALKKQREAAGFKAMLCFALGEDPETAEANPLARVQAEIKEKDDLVFLEDIAERPDAEGAVSGAEWARVYRIVEIAQRIHEGFAPPVPLKISWINLHPAEKATRLSPFRTAVPSASHPAWATFGRAQKSSRPEHPPEPNLGWALASPLLMLAEGTRDITLRLEFDPVLFVADKIRPLITFPSSEDLLEKGPFQLELSTKKGWMAPETLKITLPKEASALSFALHFSEAAEAITAHSRFGNRPVLRIMLRPLWDAGRKTLITHYTPFKSLVLLKTQLGVAVSGLSSLKLQNDEKLLDAKKPFEPFTGSPSAGSRFYLGHPELLQKQLDELAFQVEWMGAPKDMQAHYRNYGLGEASSFSAKLALVDRNIERVLLPKADLFAAPDAGASQRIQTPSATERKAGKTLDDLLSVPGGFQYKRDLKSPLEGEPSGWTRHLLLELNAPDFQHGNYARLAAEKALAFSADIASKKEDLSAAEYQVNPPYTPKIKKLRVSYSASLEIASQGGVDSSNQVFHLHPFGQHEVQSEGLEKGLPFLPQYAHEGELYIGIKALKPPQELSILFQMAEGSANPDLKPEPIQWSVLSQNRWQPLKDGQILLDSSRGLKNSGIMVFTLPAVLPSTRLPGDLYWLRAAVSKNTTSLCDAIALHTQAVSAIFVDQGNDPGHLAQPLPPESISDLSRPLPEIASVLQPYTSFGGKMAEADAFFYTRVSERLRHKQRAVTLWDYERLVLDHFPQIYKVKCLPADPGSPFSVPGQVDIVVIPDIRGKLPFNPFKPKAPADLIAEIADYLSDKHSPYASIRIKNAHYVSLKVRFGVRFKAGLDTGYHKNILNEDLNRFLSPWAYEEGADIVIGRKIYANSIIDFLDRRPYVDYVVELKLFSAEDGLNYKIVLPTDSEEGYFVRAGRPDGVLVAARQHTIDLIPEAGYEERSFGGLNYMKVELDFIVE